MGRAKRITIDKDNTTIVEGDQAVGAGIVKRALEEPIRQIVVNAGAAGAVIVQEAKTNEKRG